MCEWKAAESYGIAGAMKLEICVSSVKLAMAAKRGAAQYGELCGDLMEGGITPPHGPNLNVRRRVAIELFVLIRPRGGNLCYSEGELELIENGIAHTRDLGANSVTLGVLGGTVCAKKRSTLWVRRCRDSTRRASVPGRPGDGPMISEKPNRVGREKRLGESQPLRHNGSPFLCQ